jgi:sterol desaturase/sphingolipid hydroxylase (fatty acid hydroxylase superfamily)
MEIIFGIFAFFIWLGVLLYMLILAGGVIFYILYVVFTVIFLILETLFKKFHLPQKDFSRYEKKIKIYEMQSIRKMIKRAKSSKIYFYSGMIMIVISFIFEFLFFLGVLHNEYLWSFWIFGLVCLFFGVYYLKIHRRFHEKRL